MGHGTVPRRERRLWTRWARAMPSPPHCLWGSWRASRWMKSTSARMPSPPTCARSPGPHRRSLFFNEPRLLVVAGKIAPEERTRVRQDLLNYCERDTWAMVKVLEKLREVAGIG